MEENKEVKFPEIYNRDGKSYINIENVNVDQIELIKKENEKNVRLTCFRCGRVWRQKTDLPPRTCPNKHCHSVYWDSPKIQKEKIVQAKVEKLGTNLFEEFKKEEQTIQHILPFGTSTKVEKVPDPQLPSLEVEEILEERHDAYYEF